MFARWPGQAIGQKHKDTLGVGGPVPGTRQQLVEDAPQPELLEKRTHDQGGAPGRGIENLDGIRIFTAGRGRAEQGALKFGQQRSENILATEVGDDALFDFAIVAIGFDNADVLVDGAVGGRDLDGADEHGLSITTGITTVKV